MRIGKDGIRWPGRSPFGALKALQKNPLEVVMRSRFELGTVVDLRVPTRRYLAAASPGIAESLLLTSANHVDKRTVGYKQLRRVLGNGIATSDGAFWLRQRRLMQPAFHRERVRRFAHIMVVAARELADSWSKTIASGEPVDMAQEMVKVTVRVAGQTLLSADVTSASMMIGSTLAQEQASVNYRMSHPLALPEWVPTSGNRALVRSRRELDALILGIIAQRRSGNVQADDLLSMLMSATDADTGAQMDDLQLRDEVMTMFVAGHDTTAAYLIWTLALLSLHPAVEQKLRDELSQKLGTREPTAEDVPQLTYLNCVLKEVLRLYPPLWILFRRLTADCVIEGWNFPKNSTVFLSPYVLHRLPESFANPEQFDPERWAFDVVPPRGAYIPFGLGPRKCIGESMAQLQAQLTIATLLQRVRLNLVPGQTLEPEPLVTLKPRGGMMMRIASATTPL